MKMNVEKNILSYLDRKEELLSNLAKDIWNHPQIALEETYASKLQANLLQKEGFSIKNNIGNIPTAFIAEWGEGKPIIGILGEYDALPGLSQKVSPIKDPVKQGHPGHGCGHNLLGTASLGAVIAIKEEMKSNRIKGTIRYYGCPAEETLVGKVFMVKCGAFNNLDASITWHPGNLNGVWNASTLALYSFKLNFHGRTAHSAVEPESGCSSLDGVVLTDIGINYLREHTIQEARIHSVITNGGIVPNVVPDYAQSWYFIRAPHIEQVQEIYSRVLDIAKGAALMTGTTFDTEFITGCYEFLPNKIIGKIILKKFKKIGAPKFTEEERKFAEELERTLPINSLQNRLNSHGLTIEDVGGLLNNKIIETKGPWAEGKIHFATTDVGDVSQITPTAQFRTACLGVSFLNHKWQSTAFFGSSIGIKGMMVAAKTMALVGFDLITKPSILSDAQEEFMKATSGKRYISQLPDDLNSPIHKNK